MKRTRIAAACVAFAALAFWAADAGAMYNPAVGRFAQRDPLGFSDGANNYAYVGNNPAQRMDPAGEKWYTIRDGRDRATVINDSPDDTVEALAKIVRLEPSQFESWLRPYPPYALPASAIQKVGQCGSYSVPNRVVVAVGSLRSFGIFAGPFYDLAMMWMISNSAKAVVDSFKSAASGSLFSKKTFRRLAVPLSLPQ